jgi:23S rRNA (uridine2552-2'-O)-methyltransferase
VPRRGRNPYQRPDHYTKQAKERGFAARSVFKLEDIDRRAKLLKSGQRVLDLGAAPGSWSQYASAKVGAQGRVLAVDLFPFAQTPPPNVTVLEGDALSMGAPALSAFAPYDVVLSDMAPRTTGMPAADQARSFELFMRALELASELVVQGGSFVGKIFMGGDFPLAKRRVKELFAEERTMRPEATRDQSFEIFVVGLGRR